MAKQVTDRLGAIELVVAAAEIEAAQVQNAFSETYTPYLKPQETLPDLGLAAHLIARAMQARAQTMKAASDAHDRELSDDAAPRETRDAAAAALTAEVVAMRATVESTFGSAQLKVLGIEGRADDEPKAILSKAQKLVVALKDPSVEWPKPIRKGVKVDPTAWVDDLETHIATLQAALKDVAREVREAQQTLDAKTSALAESDAMFARGAGWLSATFRLIGNESAASKVRPSNRRPGRASEPDEPHPTAPAPLPIEPAKV
ncbi:MAG: hypothetical protein WCI05_01815 [Myxococcales bacterium]|jgi:hypothetical protein